jgi:hypothetical protein
MGSTVDLAGSVFGEQGTQPTSRVTGPIDSTADATVDRKPEVRRVGVGVLVGAVVRGLSAVRLTGRHRDPISDLLWAGLSGQAMVVIDQHQSRMRASEGGFGMCYGHRLVRAPVHDDDL